MGRGNFEVKREATAQVAGASAGQYEIICTSLKADNHASTSLLIFYRPDNLPDAQPIVSKH